MSILQRSANVIKDSKRFWFPVLLVVVYFEILFSVIFWFKDTPTALDSSDLIDGPYLYYLSDFIRSDRETYGLNFINGIEKKEGFFRIFVTGSSAGMQLAQTKDENGSLVLERTIRETLNNNSIEVISAGIPAYTLEQEFIHAQLILQKFAPDFIISLNGFTDMSTFIQNRFNPTFTFFPPMHFRKFHLIEITTQNKSFIGRFLPLFKNNVRAFDYIYSFLIESQDYTDLSDINSAQIDLVANEFYSLADDYRDFLGAKKIGYAGFLQPYKNYKRSNPNHTREGFSDDNSKIRNAIYYAFDTKFIGDDDLFSLTTVLDSKMDSFLDHVHLDLEGIEILSKEIATHIKKKIEATESYQKPSL